MVDLPGPSVHLYAMSEARPVACPTVCADESPKRRAVVEAAADLFLSQGYGAVSMDVIAREAGVSKATLYAYFPSKEKLFATIVASNCVRLQTLAASMPERYAADTRAMLTGMGVEWLTFFLQPRTLGLYRVVMAEAPRFPELAASFYEAGPHALKQWMINWIAAETAAGRLDVQDAYVAAEHFLALLRTSVFFRATLDLPPAPTEADIARVANAAADTFLRAFGP